MISDIIRLVEDRIARGERSVTRQAFAEAAEVTKATIDNWRASGLRSIKAGGAVVFEWTEIARWLDSRRTPEPAKIGRPRKISKGDRRRLERHKMPVPAGM